LFVAARGFIEQRIALINPTPKQVYYYLVEERSGQDEISVFFNVEPKDAKLFVDNVPTDINKTVSVPLGTVNVRLEREGYRPISQALVTSPEKVNFEFRMQEVEPEIVSIIANEKDARVVVDGQEHGLTDATKRYSLFLYPGDYTVEVQKSGYLSHSQTISVAEESSNEFHFRIEKNTGIIEFDVQPRNANVSLNKASIGSERSIERTPGRYRIDIELPDHEPHSETIDLSRGERKTIRAKLEPYRGSLQFSVTPSNAQVVLKDGKGKEVKRWEGLQLVRDLPVGEYEVEVALNGYITQKEKLRISKDERVSVEVALKEGQPIVHCGNKPTAVFEVTNPITGKTWMDRNLGASRAATSSTDGQAYGDLYQWGRFADGHQCRISKTTTTRSSSDQLGHAMFILSEASPNDWRQPQNDNLWQGVNGVNNPCPSGYRLPTDSELNAERLSWNSNNAEGAFSSTLKLPAAGYRNGANGSIGVVDSNGGYWSSSVSVTIAGRLYFSRSDANILASSRVRGHSIRCIKD